MPGPSFREGAQPPKPLGGLYLTAQHKVVVFERKTLEPDSRSWKQSLPQHGPGGQLRLLFSHSRQDSEWSVLAFLYQHLSFY